MQPLRCGKRARDAVVLNGQLLSGDTCQKPPSLHPGRLLALGEDGLQGCFTGMA